MAVLSILTSALALALCAVLGFLFLKSRQPEATSRSSIRAESRSAFRPWVDQDLQDDTEPAAKEEGKRHRG